MAINVFMRLLLDAQSARAGFEDCSADFALGERDVEEGGWLIGVTGWLPLLLAERGVLLFGGIVSPFSIPAVVGFVGGGSAPVWERLAEKQAARPLPRPPSRADYVCRTCHRA